MQTARECVPSADDDLWQRMEKLYVRICSVGDEIYSAGSGVGRLTLDVRDIDSRIHTLTQRIDLLEKPVADLRKEFAEIQKQLFTMRAVTR
jgi:predicted  nucleic acid-binding Zn-ribbon protein